MIWREKTMIMANRAGDRDWWGNGEEDRWPGAKDRGPIKKTLQTKD